ncbi:MAG TPA: hypothetical protein VL101_14105, partial [Nordella sp.]|nr:hypothetical protein [Nordella sp.]
MGRRSVVGTLPLALMAFAVLCAAITASAQDLNKFVVSFTSLIINDCPEVGRCDWKLLCHLGDETETELIRIAEADTGETIPVNAG